MKKRIPWLIGLAVLIAPTGIMFSKFCRSQAPPEENSAKAVYLVMRSQYEVPMGHRVLKFDEPGLLAWFRKHWRDEKELVARDSPSGISMAMNKWGRVAPGSLPQLREFAASISAEGSILFDEHAIQCITDDDEIDTPWYLFDDVFAARHLERVTYLLREDWQLPETFAAQGIKAGAEDLKHVTEGAGEGCVYGIFLSAYDGMTVTDITGNFRFDGVRLPGFSKYLAHRQSPMKDEGDASKQAAWPEELVLLRSLVLKSDQESFDGFLQAVDHDDLNRRCKEARELNNFQFRLRNPDAKKPGSIPVDLSLSDEPHRFLEGDAAACQKDWLIFDQYLQRVEEKNTSSAWTYSMREPLVQASPHLCQIRFIQEAKYAGGGGLRHHPTTWAYIFFDDLWLAENRVLGESILRYGAGAEVLKVGEDLEE